MIAELNVEFMCLPPTNVNPSDEAAFKRFVLEAGEVSRNTLPALYQKRSCDLSCASRRRTRRRRSDQTTRSQLS